MLGVNFWINLVNVLLIGVAAGAIVWALRQQALLQRVFAGLKSLRQGKRSIRLRQTAEDTEPILQEFDALAEWLQQTEHLLVPTDSEQKSQWQIVLGQVGQAIRPTLVTIKSHLALLAQNGNPQSIEISKEHLRQIQTQVDGLLRLLEAPATLSELRHGVNGLRRDLGASVPVSPDTVLIIDEDVMVSTVFAGPIKQAGGKVLNAADADSAGVMALAVGPILVMVNVTTGDGQGWKALPALLHSSDLFQSPIWLYSLDSTGAGQLCTPAGIWLWPSNNVQRLISNSWDRLPQSISIFGDESLAMELKHSLAEAGVEVVIGESAHTPTLPYCCTLATEPENGDVSDYVLVVPADRIDTDASELAQAFQLTHFDQARGIEHMLTTIVGFLERQRITT